MNTGPAGRVDPRLLARLGFALLILVAGGVVLSQAIAADSGGSRYVHEPDAMGPSMTVVTTHFNDDRNGSIAAFDAEGDLVYRNATYTRYFDVDPVANESRTVEYVAEQNVDPARCGISAGSGLTCVRQVVERLDLERDSTTRVFDRTIKTARTDSWHDVDRVSEDELLVADLFEDRAFVVNTTTGLTTWQWSATADFDLSSGGGDKTDWTHINDVEQVRDGVVMASLRNHDQVVFVDRERGLLEEWTLGADGDYEVLYEQHNPDYVPAERGGPAVVVADSENNRIVEYQRTDGEWVRTWTYADAAMEWPRDADRLPNGNTLITDTHTNRIVEVDGDGEAVWEVSYPKAYEAERLGTGDESAGGESARELGLSNVTEQSTADVQDGDGALRSQLRGLVPNKVKHGLLWVLPAWASFFDVVLIGVCVAALLAWALLELRWSDRVRLQWPVRFER